MDERFYEMDKKVSLIEADIRTIKENHLAHIEADVASILSKLDRNDNRLIAGLAGFVCILVAAVGALVFVGLTYGN